MNSVGLSYSSNSLIDSQFFNHTGRRPKVFILDIIQELVGRAKWTEEEKLVQNSRAVSLINKIGFERDVFIDTCKFCHCFGMNFTYMETVNKGIFLEDLNCICLNVGWVCEKCYENRIDYCTDCGVEPICMDCKYCQNCRDDFKNKVRNWWQVYLNQQMDTQQQLNATRKSSLRILKKLDRLEELLRVEQVALGTG